VYASQHKKKNISIFIKWEFLMASLRLIGLGAFISILVAGCGGGSSDSTKSAGFSQTYTASASVGEVLQYSVDTAALTYSYSIIKSSYGCELPASACHSGSGTLIKNTDGTYSPSDSTSSKIHVIENGLIAGSVNLLLNGTYKRIPIFGMANPATTVASLAGNYNFMSLQCTGRSFGVFSGCSTYQGSLTVNSSGSFSSCTGGDITAASPTCTSTTTGMVSPLGSGLFQFQSTSPAGAATNYMLAFTAPNGQKVGLIDFNDPSHFGYGQAVVSSIAATTNDSVAGRYAYSNVYGSSGIVTLNSNGTTSTGLTVAGNTPWTGIATVTGGSAGTGYGMLAGNGVYVYRNPTIPGQSAYFEVGLRIN
jgi:hypothetical protein